MIIAAKVDTAAVIHISTNKFKTGVNLRNTKPDYQTISGTVGLFSFTNINSRLLIEERPSVLNLETSSCNAQHI